MPGLALFEPDQPGNLGAAMRLCACFAVPLHIIEPCGFPLDERRVRRAGMDYMAQVAWRRHADFAAFEDWRLSASRRLILLSTSGSELFHRTTFQAGDLLLVGAESRGAPPAIHQCADRRVRIPLAAGARSLNVVVAAGIVLAEALRQSGMFDGLSTSNSDLSVQ